ncbi:MAG: hypothetical protein JWO08_3282 [Verrucomicrobiaceae bacterium]|nr:hypothetical protein [Verrucomicrobiaceae bacterium]
MASKDKKGFGCGVLGIIVLIAILALFNFIVGPIMKAGRDVEDARAEFKRMVKPDELREWVLTQLKKYPHQGFNNKSALEWPANFPTFSGRRCEVYLYPDYTGRGLDHAQGASIVWNFLDQGLKVTVLLMPDGSPAETENEQ